MEIAVEDGAAGSRVPISSRSNKQNEQSKYLKAAPLGSGAAAVAALGG